ncbi:EEF1A lysine methyltransferase 1 [Planococcus citri]|uniref:EEF1A lysine methyltransferase 1 n=1 Tax=Planococcus citri TaxID=170843 RepID=UPI0031F8EB89
MTDEDDNDDMPCLSTEAMLALQEFMNEKQMQNNLSSDSNTDEPLKVNDIEENWQLSQFWYDDQTAEQLSSEALNEIENSGKIALIGCPSIYYFLKKRINDSVSIRLLDVDKRFSAYKDDFIYYDYNEPLPPHIKDQWKNYFDIVVLDPPFLSEECFLKCALTAKYLAKDKIIICTGAVMESFVKKVLNANKTTFEPKHKNNLANEFCCYINYSSKSLKLASES